MRSTERRFQKIISRLAMMSLAACHDDPVASDASNDVIDLDVDDGACNAQPFDAADDSQIDCSTFVSLPCGLPESSVVSECYPDLETCAEACTTHNLFYCVLTKDICTIDAGIDANAKQTTMECVTCLGGGRRPRGFVESAKGHVFARLAHMEAASVYAFRDLERSLVAFNAPQRIIAATQRAQRDERRHTRVMARIAKRAGANTIPLHIKQTQSPTLFEVLVANAIEGCANETFGALTMTITAERSKDSRVRRSLRTVARDEACHAALAWEILRWGIPRISRGERVMVRQKLDAAWDALERKDPRARHLRVATAREIAW